MRFSDTETLLRDCRPKGPPPELRIRLLALTTPPRIWSWAAAAAAALLTTTLCHYGVNSMVDAVEIGRSHLRGHETLPTAQVILEVVGDDDARSAMDDRGPFAMPEAR